jgi:RHS repeat-associated protein
MDDYGRIRQASIGGVTGTWTYDANNMLSQIAATGVQQYGYSFNVNTGNLNSRTNTLKTLSESFGYDAVGLDRLTSVSGPANLAVDYTSNNNGNIQSKSDAGTGSYAYLNTPYAVSNITGAQNISLTPQQIDYYSFEKVKKITEGTKTADFVYNADQQRVRMILKDNGVTTKTRWYFGGSQERDHLGTITHLKSGSTVYEYSFDAWGRRRDKDDWTYTLSGEPALLADRGFTAHEHLTDFNLVNMNGRLYDPVVGRFLSPDNFVQIPNFSQNFNRYSYALNNPLVYVDEDGEWLWLVFAIYGAWNLGVRAGVAAENSGGHFWEGFWKGAVVGFTTGALAPLAPFGTEWLGSTLWYATVATAAQAGTTWAMGENNYGDLWKGALIGGALGFVSSEQFGNWARNKGFVSNDQVLKNFRTGQYPIPEGSTWQQEALNYFFGEGTYDPNLTSKNYQAENYWGATDTKTGEISFGNLAFKDYATLKGTYMKESFTARNVLQGKFHELPKNIQGLGADTYLEEIYGYVHMYKIRACFLGILCQ